MRRRGKPADGYDSVRKAEYRKSVWDFVDSHSGVLKHKRNVLVLDTKSRHEVKHLLTRGYKEKQITIVNRDQNELYSKSDTMRRLCGDVFDILRNARRERFSVINLDLCGTYTGDLGRRLRDVAGRVRCGDIVAVTVWRRSLEPPGTFPSGKPGMHNAIRIDGPHLRFDKDKWRLFGIIDALGSKKKVKTGIYGMYGAMLYVVLSY